MGLFGASDALKDLDSGPLWSETLKQYEPVRGTLTLTSEGPVLGCPADATDSSCAAARDAVEAWRQASQHQQAVLALPWPVDVTDIRR